MHHCDEREKPTRVSEEASEQRHSMDMGRTHIIRATNFVVTIDGPATENDNFVNCIFPARVPGTEVQHFNYGYGINLALQINIL